MPIFQVCSVGRLNEANISLVYAIIYNYYIHLLQQSNLPSTAPMCDSFYCCTEIVVLLPNAGYNMRDADAYITLVFDGRL